VDREVPDPKDVTAFIATALTEHRSHVGDHLVRGNSLAADLLGTQADGARDAVTAYLAGHPTRAAHVTLAIVLGGVEGSTSKETWRYEANRTRFAGYFTQLQTWGYVLSDVERIVVDGEAPEGEADEAEQDEPVSDTEDDAARDEGAAE